jgi:hypothetical protein
MADALPVRKRVLTKSILDKRLLAIMPKELDVGVRPKFMNPSGSRIKHFLFELEDKIILMLVLGTCS